MKKNILIITREQFGYLTDTYNYCLFLKDELNITYICFDERRPKIECNGIEIIYVSKSDNINSSCYNLSKYIIEYVKTSDKKFYKIFCVYFRLCFLIPIMLKNKNYILDIRTGNVNNNKLKNYIGNLEIKFNSLFFKNITLISESLANKLKIKKYEILPLGAKRLVNQKKDVNEMNLVYVGTLNNRKIYETVEGYYKYLSKKTTDISTSYTIIGDGSDVEIEKINTLINKYNISDRTKFIGRVNNDDLGEYFERCNVGLSYIPITDYYNIQPPTKTYEYIINGLICIATATDENKKIINDLNGVLCSDNSNSIAESILNVEKNLCQYNTNNICRTVETNSWENISKNIFLKNILK